MNMKTFIVDSKFNYREFYCNTGQVNKYYEIENAKTDRMIRSIPDACVDIQFTRNGGSTAVYACGSFLRSDRSPTGNQSWCFGVKFHPGVIPVMLRKNLPELIGSRRELDGIPWIDRLADRIFRAESFEERMEIFEQFFPFEQQFERRNLIVEYVREIIRKNHGHVNIAEIAKTMRYSQKYMDRVFRAETGLTMKKYASIIQIQTAIRYLQEGRIDDVYEGLGYYDQSYFIREFKKNTSVTPGQFCREEQISIV